MNPSFVPGCAAVLACTFGALPAAQATTHYHLVDLVGVQARAVNAAGAIAGQSPTGAPGLYVDSTWKSKHDNHHYGVAYGIDAAGNMIGEVKRGKHDGGAIVLMYYPRGAKGVAIPLPHGSTSGDAVFNDISPGGISPDGTKVVGTYVDAVARIAHCFTWDTGAAASTDIGLPAGFDLCETEGVNDAGELVGQLWSEASGFSGFTWSGGSFRLVGPTGFGGADLSAINAAGHATGDFGGSAAFWDGTTLATIPDSGGLKMSHGTAINNHDAIVGWGSSPSAFTTLIYSSGVLRDLVPMIDSTAGWDFSVGVSAMGINDDGTIVGVAFHDNGDGTASERGYMLVPLD